MSSQENLYKDIMHYEEEARRLRAEAINHAPARFSAWVKTFFVSRPTRVASAA